LGSSGFVVLLRGVNVGGNKTFRPAQLAKELGQFDVVNIGAAGTFVVRGRVTQARFRAELARRLPFDSEVIIISGRELLDLTERDPFTGQPAGGDIVRFLTVLSRRPHKESPLPVQFPPKGKWLVRILRREGRFVLGMYRRDMKTIGYLGATDRLFDVPITTRNWNTVESIVRRLA
jgi:uncharacterized protein (DUF1697 family)